jgi:hypothetical protein
MLIESLPVLTPSTLRTAAAGPMIEPAAVAPCVEPKFGSRVDAARRLQSAIQGRPCKNQTVRFSHGCARDRCRLDQVHRRRQKYSSRAAALETANFGFHFDQPAMQIFVPLVTGRAAAGQLLQAKQAANVLEDMLALVAQCIAEPIRQGR